ncbi:hypothetical protein [Phenylobacterium sp.]|jgi:hypothetical protein
MDVPQGLRKPHRIAELIVPLMVLGGVATAVFYAFLHVAHMI